MNAPAEFLSRRRLHLSAGLYALAAVALVLAGGGYGAVAYEREAFRPLLPILTDPKNRADEVANGINYIEHLKNQGMAVQRRAFERTDQLPLYGSSELVKTAPDKASWFFRTFPTGFSVFPVGKAGSTSLIMLERLAALGSVTEGKRVAISLSPSWFFIDAPAEGQFKGNFSPQQALAALLNGELSRTFRRDLARDLLRHGTSMKRDEFVHYLCARMAGDGLADRMICGALWPLGKLREELDALQDHFEVCFYIRKHVHHDWHMPPPEQAQLDWQKLIADAAKADVPGEPPTMPGDYFKKLGDAETVRENLAHGQEWEDLELLVRGLHEMGLQARIFCMPPNGFYLEQGGISKEMLRLFEVRIREVGGRYGASVETFDDHLEDFAFRSDDHDHLSSAGWMYYNRSLDAFFHAPVAAGRRP